MDVQQTSIIGLNSAKDFMQNFSPEENINLKYPLKAINHYSIFNNWLNSLSKIPKNEFLYSGKFQRLCQW